MSVPTELVVIADDLTGAADSASLLTGLGPTSVVLDAEAPWPEDTVLAVDTDSRHCDPATAQERVLAVAQRAGRLGARVVKKVDSTLRGNIAAELRAMTEAVDGQVLLVVAPAFPATLRTTHGGVVHVAGERLAAHGSDGDVVALLGRGGIRATHLPQGDRLATRMTEAHAAGFAAVVVDADSDEDLAAVVAAANELAGRVILVGSGGLTRPLAGATPPPRRADLDTRGSTLLVIGSYSEPARAQRSRLVEAGVTPLLLSDASRLKAALRDGPVVLSPDPSASVVRADATAVARQIAETVAAVVDDIGTLVLTGGETARAVLTTAGVSRLVVAGELEPGVVQARVPELDLDVVTKAGAFGDPDTLLRCLPSCSTPAAKEGTV
jgi:D-threonate/D-erythronate kinase